MKKILKQAAGVAAVILAGALVASAQPYFTNTSPQAGAYQYNQNYAQPLQPSKTLSQQYQAGILAGAFAPSQWYLLTNTFPTNIFTTAPIVTANGSGPTSQSVCSTNVVTVVSSSPTNFILQCSVNNQTVYWEAIGH
jgi:hypothetical protein